MIKKYVDAQSYPFPYDGDLRPESTQRRTNRGRNELHAIRSGKWKLHFPHTYRSMIGRAPGKDGIPCPLTSTTMRRALPPTKDRARGRQNPDHHEIVRPRGAGGMG